MKVVQVSIGRFHHFHLARQMERFGMLDSIWTGYPGFKLADETGIPKQKVRSFPWLQTLYMAWPRLPVVGRRESILRDLSWMAQETLDRRVAISLREPRVVIALSGAGEHCGLRAKALGGRYVCDRGSSHIRYQDRLMREEYDRWEIAYRGTDRRIVAKEEREYAAADMISVPSEFARQSFVAMGVAPEKLLRIPYGARLERFKPDDAPPSGPFSILFVGHVSLRKGIPYLLEAFARFKHPHKELKIVGGVDPAIEPLLARLPKDDVVFLGTVPNAELPHHYRNAHVLVLPSIEEGLAMVMAEAMASGCPVIASRNTGAEDLFTADREGLIVPIRSSDAIVDAFDRLAGDRHEAGAIRHNAMARIRSANGWNEYGSQWRGWIEQLTDKQDKVR